MAKAIAGAAEIAGGAVLMATGVGGALGVSLLLTGISTEAAAIAAAIGSKAGIATTTRQPASYRQIIRGEQRVPGVIVFCSTTGGSHTQYNLVIVLATHQCEAIENLYLDGRQVYWDTSSAYNQTVNGVNFGGNADGNGHYGPNGVAYNFGGKVFCAGFYGNQTNAPTVVSGSWVGPSVINGPEQTYPGFCSALQANDPTWGPDSKGNIPYLANCCYVYLKLEFDTAIFPQFPEIRFTVRGKNDIWDPRTSTYGYSTNWALQVADAITDPTWGLGDNTVNQDQLIAAANVCDELVACAAGDEARYTLHWHYDTSTAPGDAISRMMDAAAGRLSRIGGEWYIWPAYWQGPSFTFDQDVLVDGVQWSPTRSFDQLINRVTGTYIAANYPYSVAGDLYDSNGYYQGQLQNNFPYGFQPTNYPQVACDALHGFGEDVYLIADTPNSGAYSATTAYAAGTVVIYNSGLWQANETVPAGNAPGTNDGSGNPYWSPTGNYLPKEIDQPCVLSIAQAQRVGMIFLLRNRQQGSGTLPMNLAAYQLQPTDVIQMNFSPLSWTNKVLEVVGTTLRFVKPQGSDTPGWMVEVAVQETDPSVYEWVESEELTPYDVPVMSGGVVGSAVQPPTNVLAVCDLTTALVQPDGTVTPRIEVTWTEPNDPYVTNGGSIEIQMCAHGSGAWQTVALLGGQTTLAFLGGIVSGNAYDIRIRSLRASGGVSVWVEVDNAQSGTQLHATGLTPVAPIGTLLAHVISSTDAEIVVNPFVATIPGFTANCLSSQVTLTGLTPITLYYVYYVDLTFSGGAITPVATTNTADFENKPGYWLIGSISTPAYLSGSGAQYLPTNFVQLGQTAANNQTAPFAGGSGTAFIIGDSGATGTQYYGEGLYEGFPSVTSTAGQQLSVYASTRQDGPNPAQWAITASIGGGAKPPGTLGSLNNRGAWAASTAYAQWDTFTESGVTYMVVTAYTSGGSFGATDIAKTCFVLASGTGAVAATTYSVPVPTGTNLANIIVNFTANSPTGDYNGMSIWYSEIYVQ